MPLDAIPEQMPWDEALRLTKILAADSTSQVGTAFLGWDAPRSREWFLLADTIDVIRAQHSKKRPKPYPRPGDSSRKRLGGTKHSQTAVLAALAARAPRPEGGEHD